MFSSFTARVALAAVRRTHLKFRRDVAGAVDPAEIFGRLSVYALEVALDGLSKVLGHDAHHTSSEEEDNTALGT